MIIHSCVGNSSPNRKVASDSRVIRVCNRPLQERHRTGLSYTRKNESRVSIEGPEVLLEPNSAQAIAVTLHELATNAAKYGVLSAAEGQIEVKWSHTADGPSTVRANSRLCACAHARSQGRQVTGRNGAFEFGLRLARREMPCRCRYRRQSQTGTKPPAV